MFCLVSLADNIVRYKQFLNLDELKTKQLKILLLFYIHGE